MVDIAALVSSLDAMKIEYLCNCPMSLYTSFKIGGPADVMIKPHSVEQLKTVLNVSKKHNVPVFAIGKGSNLLISDDGIEGAVINISSGLDEIKMLGETTVECGAGASLSALCNFCLEHGLSGLEFAYGIPGSVGGAIYMNAGAYGGEIKNVITSAAYLTADGEECVLPAEKLCLSYRKSRFSDTDDIILSARFELIPDNTDNIRERMDDYIKRRKDKQPLSYPSAGSTFKRPQGYFAGALIEQSGLKGFSVGGAQVSEKHAGFVINKGGATCKDVTDLMAHIVKIVEEKFGVTLEAEIIKSGR